MEGNGERDGRRRRMDRQSRLNIKCIACAATYEEFDLVRRLLRDCQRHMKRSVVSLTHFIQVAHLSHVRIQLITNTHKNVNSVFQSASLCVAGIKRIRPSDLLMNTLLMLNRWRDFK